MDERGTVMDTDGRVARVRARGSDFSCEGNVHLVPTAGGGKSRTSDILNEDNRFLALTDVILYEAGAGANMEPQRYEVMLLRRDEIKFLVWLDSDA
jgi:hypothetical protein